MALAVLLNLHVIAIDVSGAFLYPTARKPRRSILLSLQSSRVTSPCMAYPSPLLHFTIT